MKISVIATVLNEEASLPFLLDSLMEQTTQADEIVVVDGGSTDRTVEVLMGYAERLPIKIIEYAGCNISEGRNRAITAATYPIIAVTDAGVKVMPEWLEKITRPIREGKAKTVGGWFESDPHTDFEVVMGATVLPDVSQVDPNKFLPPNRSIAYTKDVWERAGGYPEWLDYCEDLVFNIAVKKTEGVFFFVPDAVVQFRPRGSFRSFFKQYYLYARGDGKADLWRKRHAIRYVTYLFALPVLLFAMIKNGAAGLLLLFAGGVYCWQAWKRLGRAMKTRNWSGWQKCQGVLLVPILRMVGDVAKMIGYPVGVLWRSKHR